MNRSYRFLYPQIKLLFSNSNDFVEIITITSNKSQEIQPTIYKIQSEIEIPLYSFLYSHIHMMINRQYTSKQRFYELIIYDYFFKYYKKCLFFIIFNIRSKSSKKSSTLVQEGLH
jgi:hypothetical protein